MPDDINIPSEFREAYDRAGAPDIGSLTQGAKSEHLGTDAVGRGAGWQKTSNTVAVTMALHDVKQRAGMSGGELFGALVENVIAAIQGSCSPSEWQHVASEVSARIERRMTAR